MNLATCRGLPPLLKKNNDAMVMTPVQVEAGPSGALMAKGGGFGQKVRDGTTRLPRVLRVPD